MKHQIILNGGTVYSFEGDCIASVIAMNHDDSVRRSFKLYRCVDSYVAERIDNPDTLDVRYWGCECSNEADVYDFFGNEPLANYLYGRLQFKVPGLRCLV